MQLSWLCTQGCSNLEAVHTQLWHSWNCARRVHMPLNVHAAVQFGQLWKVKQSVRAPHHIFPAKLWNLRKKFGKDLVPFWTVFFAQMQSRQGTTILFLIPCYESPFFSVFTMRWGDFTHRGGIFAPPHFELPFLGVSEPYCEFSCRNEAPFRHSTDTEMPFYLEHLLILT